MMRKRKSRSRREQIAFMEFSNEFTRSDKAAQCLQTMTAKRGNVGNKAADSGFLHSKAASYRVILNILSRRMQRSTEMPMGGMTSISTSSISRIPPQTTKQSKRLNKAMK